MPRPDDLDAAVAAGIITRDQAGKLTALLATREAAAAAATSAPVVARATGLAALRDAVLGGGFKPNDSSDPDDESVRFARGFQDVFLTIGMAMLLAGVGIAGPLVLGPTVGTYAGAVVAFLLAQVYTAGRRLVLPSIALAIGFTLFVGMGTAFLIGADGWRTLFGLAGPGAVGQVPLIGGLAALAASGVFFAVFRLPFALALVALSGNSVVTGALLLAGVDRGALRIGFLVTGLATFVAAMAFDLSDPLRRTLRSDNAFWLHLVAAPLIVQSVLGLLTTQGRFSMTAVDAVVVVAVFLALGVIALVVDRRALLVAGLGYFGFAIARLMSGSTIGPGGVIAVTLLIVGGFVVALGTGWRPARRAILARFAGTRLFSHLPPSSTE